MRRLLVMVVALAMAAAATMMSAAGSDKSPRPPGLIVFSDRVSEGGSNNRELFSIRPDGTARVQITHRATYADEPELATDRHRVVFWQYQSGGERIEVMTIGRAGPTVVTDWAGEYPKWSPDGRWIAYVVPLEYGSLGGPTNGQTDIWVVRPDGRELRKVVDGRALNWGWTDQAADQAFDWSPDGRRIVFQAEGPPPPSDSPTAPPHGPTTVNVVDLATGAVTQIGVGENPNWSRHGDLIAFAARYRSILVAHPDGSGLRRVIAVPKHTQVYEPSWSHSGRRLAFYAIDFGDPHGDQGWLYLVDSDGSHRVRVRLLPRGYVEGEDQAQWSPDDRWLVFSDGLSLYRVRADGSSLTRLTHGSAPDWE